MSATSAIKVPLVVAAVAAALSACAPSVPPAGSSAQQSGPIVAVVHKSATCTCCAKHQAHLLEHGYIVEEVVYDDAVDLRAAKDAFGVPEEQRSCHTTLIDGYVVEGHMPADEIDVLLAERPDFDGIALAGMPDGAPGMPGRKSEPWTIWALDDGTATVWRTR